jgi:hypothetical protein
MPVECPSCQWPTAFCERGPAEDPSILLSGIAHIAQTAVQIVAIRISRDSGRSPDYKSDVTRTCYATNGLDTLLEQMLEYCEYLSSEFAELLGDFGSEAVELSTGMYMLIALPFRAKRL